MDLFQVLTNTTRHLAEARVEYDYGKMDEVKECLLETSACILDGIKEIDSIAEEPVIEEEQPTKPGHCQPDAAHEEPTEPEENKQETSEVTPANQKQETG